MEPTVVAALLANRRAAWVVADQALRVTSVIDVSGLLGPAWDWLGMALLDVLPELVGSEMELAAVLAGRPDPLHIDFLERADCDAKSVYVRLTCPLVKRPSPIELTGGWPSSRRSRTGSLTVA